MKIWVDADEFWPWYNIIEHPSKFAEQIDDVPEDTVLRWIEALAAAVKAQDEIRELVKG